MSPPAPGRPGWDAGISRRFPQSVEYPGGGTSVVTPASCTAHSGLVGCVATPQLSAARVAPTENRAAWLHPACPGSVGCTRPASVAAQSDEQLTRTVPELEFLSIGWTQPSCSYSSWLGTSNCLVTVSAVADVDGDGDLDLVVGFEESVTQLWLNAGRGGFSLSIPTGLEANPTYKTRALALGDLDGDVRSLPRSFDLWVFATALPLTTGQVIGTVSAGLPGSGERQLRRRQRSTPRSSDRTRGVAEARVPC